MFFTFLVVAILTAVVLVVAALTISKLIAPRSFKRASRTSAVSRRADSRGCSLRQAITCLPFCS